MCTCREDSDVWQGGVHLSKVQAIGVGEHIGDVRVCGSRI